MIPILVTAYVDPDLDGTAGAFAYAEFLQKTGREAVAGIMGKPHDEACYVLDRFQIPYPNIIEDANYFKEVILVDASDLSGLEGKIAPEKVIEIIDHRKINEADKFPNAKVQIELVGAAVTMVAEKFMEQHVSISRESATLLYAAIISNTFNFKGSVTTERDRVAAAWLNTTAQLPEDFWKDLFVAKSDLSGSKLKERIVGDFAWFVLGGKKVGIAQLEIIGAQQLLETRQEEVIIVLNELKQSLGLDIIFQNTIELVETKNFFVAPDLVVKTLLEKILNIHFVGDVAERPNLIMRKQIVPLLKEELEK